jgi:outer membrane protein assembly factor BamD
MDNSNLFSARAYRGSIVIRICILILLLNIAGCAKMKDMLTFTGEAEDTATLTVKNLVTKGMDDYAVGKYFTALEYFQEILDRYPFAPEATLAELKAADCNFFLENYAEALVLYEAFEEKHPTNEAMPYVIFQKAMCNYKQIDRIDRDVSGAEKAVQLFSQLIRAYPNSPYTSEAKARIKAARQFIANHEFFVVDFYIRRNKISEAETRLKYILATYPDAEIAPEAKKLLARIQAGNPPKQTLSSWLPKVALPDWAKFSSSEEETPENPAAKD